MRVLENDPNHAKVLQQLGWLHHQQSSNFVSQDLAIEYLEKSVSSGEDHRTIALVILNLTFSQIDNTDAQSWYLLGRCYMSQQKYPKAYEAYQQAVYRDGRNPTFWCSIGVLYYQINQYRDALDAYSRAIRLNPYISEVWYDLGTLVRTNSHVNRQWIFLTLASQYESCNNQINDALDAYQRAAELDPTNHHIKSRLQLLRSGQASGIQHPNSAPPPPPQDVHPHSYQAAGVNGPPNPQWASQGAPPPQQTNRNHAPQTLPQIPPQQPPVSQSPYRQAEPAPLSRHAAHSPDHLRQSSTDARHTPATRRGLSPSPKFNHPNGSSYPPPIQQSGPPPPPPPQQHPPTRVLNPHHSNGQPPQHALPSAPSVNGMTLPPYQRSSPPPEVKPIVDDRLTSPTAGYSHNQHLGSGIAGGAPAPASAAVAAEAAQREREDKGGSEGRSKRLREWEDEDVPAKKPASDENRARLEEIHHRPSPPRPGARMGTPPARRSSADRPRNDEYMQGPPSHQQHQQTLPSINSAHQLAALSHEPPRRSDDDRERKEVNEPAARQVDVDENYDDEEEDVNKRSGPNGHAGPGSVDKKTSPGGSIASNGVPAGPSNEP